MYFQEIKGLNGDKKIDHTLLCVLLELKTYKINTLT